MVISQFCVYNASLSSNRLISLMYSEETGQLWLTRKGEGLYNARNSGRVYLSVDAEVMSLRG